MSPLVGTLLSGRYRLDAQIGTGGMSTVYRAFDTTLERTVAVKLMHREIASDSDQLERFRREARAVAQFCHPHIVGVIDAGEDDGRPYIVFEYVEGETLKDRIRRSGMLPVDESLAYAIEITRALGAAHTRGIVHRDIKPQNVLIDEEGMAKVTDFGIARSLDEEGLTADGRVLGTTDYVSPEQALGHAVNGQSDIYSLGIVLYEMLAGDVPFHGENQVAVAMKHVRDDIPDIVRMRPEVTASVAAVLDRMTCKQLERRYADTDTLEYDLEDALAHEAARQGRATGEATAVLRTLPADGAARHAAAAARAPAAARRRRWSGSCSPPCSRWCCSTPATPIQRGTGAPRGKPPGRDAQRLRRARLGRATTTPRATPARSTPTRRALAVDGDPGTVWTTESYEDQRRRPAGRSRASASTWTPSRASPPRRSSSSTPAPGLEGDDLRRAARRRRPTTSTAGPSSAAAPSTEKKTTFKLDTERRALPLLPVWITDLPPDDDHVEIGEASLFASS